MFPARIAFQYDEVGRGEGGGGGGCRAVFILVSRWVWYKWKGQSEKGGT